jgi:ADP-ribose pyrophosphatase YjhB (NUDIX family)
VAVIGLIHHQGHILLARRAVDPARGKWALPGGFMDAGEMPEEALHRELMEEVALSIVIEELMGIYPMTGHGPVSRGIVLAYLARPAQAGRPAVQARDDVSEAGWYAPDRLPGELAFQSTQDLLQHFSTKQNGDF